MKIIEKKDLVKGEIYVDNYDECYNTNNLTHLFKATTHLKNCKSIYLKQKENGEIGHHWFNYSLSLVFRKATPEEKHWLETCIAADNFVSYEEAMKTFISEYVECIKKNSYDFGTNIIGKIYKVLGKASNNINADYLIEYNDEKYPSVSQDRFKPSTKEAYDAQFKDNFVLPEKWCIKNTNKIISDYFNTITKSHNVYNKIIHENKYLHSHNLTGNKLGTTSLRSFSNNRIRENYTEITFEQFKKYVLKEQLEEPKDKVLEKEGIDLNIGKIIKVESSEGAIYQLNDKITVFTKDSPNKGKVFIIKGFRWNNAKTKICAITELHSKNGISLDKIELYSEPVVKELSLLEQAKLKYPIGTKFKVVHLPNMILTVKNHEDYYFQTDEIVNLNVEENINGCTGGSVYRKGQWAEIVDDFKLPETWWITVENEKQLEIAKQYFSQHFNNLNMFKVGKTVGYVKNVLDNYSANAFNLLTTTKLSNPQITFEQFEQYVLHNGFKVGDRFNKIKSLLNHTALYTINEKEIIDLQYINNESVAFYKHVSNNYSGPQSRILTKNIVK